MATILHVDDEPSVGLLLEDTLTRAGHRPVDQDSLDGVIILGRWLNKIDGASFVRHFDAGDVPDWVSIAEWAMKLAEPELELIPEPRQDDVSSPVEAN